MKRKTPGEIHFAPMGKKAPEPLHVDMAERKVWKAVKAVVPPGCFDVGKYKCWMTGSATEVKR